MSRRFVEPASLHPHRAVRAAVVPPQDARVPRPGSHEPTCLAQLRPDAYALQPLAHVHLLQPALPHGLPHQRRAAPASSASPERHWPGAAAVAWVVNGRPPICSSFLCEASASGAALAPCVSLRVGGSQARAQWAWTLCARPDPMGRAPDIACTACPKPQPEDGSKLACQVVSGPNRRIHRERPSLE